MGVVSAVFAAALMGVVIMCDILLSKTYSMLIDYRETIFDFIMVGKNFIRQLTIIIYKYDFAITYKY